MTEYPIYENDQVLPSHYDIPVDSFISARCIRELWTMVCAMQERGLVVLVRAMKEGDDEEGERLVFSTHPDTIKVEGAAP